MLPFRTAARTTVHRRAASASTLSTQLRATLATPVAGPSRTAREYIARHQLRSRTLHTTSVWGKDNKRWVNSALKEGEEAKEEKDKDGKETKEEARLKKEVEEAVEEAKESEKRADESKVKATSASDSTKDSSSSASGSGSGSGSSSSSGPSSPGPKGREIAKPSIPEIYPQVLALPITRRPLFPGFYKAVTITSPAVIKAIRELIAHGQPYIGAFLLKDSESDSDVITDLDQVHPVGVFAQITSVFSSADQKHQSAEGEEGEPRPETLTAVLYPHRRIRIDELVSPMTAPPAPATADATSTDAATPAATETAKKDDAKDDKTKKDDPAAVVEPSKSEDDVASFEKEIPSVEETREALADATADKAKPTETETVEAESPQGSQIGFLHPLLPEISLTNVSNLGLQPFKKDSQVVRAIMGEILAVFKEIAQLQPIFREQSEFSCRSSCLHASPS